MLMKSLVATLAYQNEDLLIKFREFYSFSDEDLEFIFTELKTWLWIKALQAHKKIESPEDESLQFHFHVLPSFRVVDELWHVFILFTAEYRAFCQEYFGVYVDHTPSLPHRKLSEPAYRTDLEKEFYFIYQHLGPATLELWMHDLGERFPESLINSKYIYRGFAAGGSPVTLENGP